MANWMQVVSNTNGLYAVEMKDGAGDFYVASEWFATQPEAEAFADDVIAARVAAIAQAAVKAANDPLDRTVEINYAE